MALFGRNKDEDEDYEDDEIENEIEEREERRISRKLKDLHSENKKKRKEPPKPWGKKERLMILIIFTVTILVSGFLALFSRGFIFKGTPEFNLPKLDLNSLNFFKEETIMIEKPQ